MNKKILALLTVIVIALCSVVALAADLKELTVDGIDSGDDVGNFIEPLTIYDYEAVTSGRIPRQGHIVRDSAGNVKGYLSDDEYKKTQPAAVGTSTSDVEVQTGKVTFNYIKSMADAFMKYMGGDGSVQSVVTKYALRVFYLLAGIQFVWSFVNLALSSDLTFQGIVANLVRQGFTLTFFYWLVKNVAQYGGYLRQYLGMIANEAVGLSSLSDATVQKIVGYSSSQYGSVPDIGELYILTLECCHNLISSAAKNAGWGMGYIYALGVMFISIPILWTISKIILKIFLVYLQTYFALALSMLVMGLSALDATRRHAIESISKVVSVLLKYFAIQLILGVVVALLVEWTALTEGLNGLNALLVSLALMGGVSIFSGLVDELPEFISGFMGPGGIGSSVSGMFSGVTGPIHTARTIKQDVNTAAAPLVAGLSATQNALWGHNLFAPVGGGNAFGGNRNRSSVFDNLRAAGFNKAGNAVESLYNRGALGSLGVGAYKAYKTYKNLHGEEAPPPSGGAGQASSTDPASGTAERNKPAKAGSGKTP